MPVTVTADGANIPPTMKITIASSDGSSMTAVALTRTASGVKAATRVQPSTGVASRYIEDPEAPWDTDVVYTATYTTATLGTVTEASPAVQLTPTVPAIWAIHPTVPSRSMPLDQADFSVAGIASIADVVRAAQATQHPILGSDLPILTKLGNRKAAATSVDVTTVTEQEMFRFQSLFADETPVLIRVPGAWHWGIEQGYYAVGDTSEARRLQYGPEQSRTLRLPLNRVQPPAGVQQSSWDWAGLIAGYADFNAVANRFADWNALIGNNPS